MSTTFTHLRMTRGARYVVPCVLLGLAALAGGCSDALSPPATPAPRSPELQLVVTGFDLTAVTTGADHSCGLTREGLAYCWGSNFDGQLGIGAPPGVESTPVAVAPPAGATTPVTFTSISAGEWFTCGVARGGQAFCWGYNASGQLGTGVFGGSETVPTPVLSPGGATTPFVATSISAGGAHSCALTKSGSAYCWGHDLYGQLGDAVAALTTAVPVPVAPPAGSTTALAFTSVSAGYLHTCAVAKGGQVFCWGSNEEGALGNGSASLGAGPDLPTPIASALLFTSVSAGLQYTCAVAKGGQAFCWGLNSEGQLGSVTVAPAFAPIPVAPPAGSSALTFTSVSAGYTHTCGVSKGGQAYCWGDAASGKLGIGVAGPDSDVPVPVSGFVFTSVDAGAYHSCGVTKGNGAYCWGSNGFGQLGNGGSGSSTAPFPVSPPAP